MICRSPIWQGKDRGIKKGNHMPGYNTCDRRTMPLAHQRPFSLPPHHPHPIPLCHVTLNSLLSFELRSPARMIDHIFGRPSPSWKRTQVGVQSVHRNSNIQRILAPNHQVLFVLIFWTWRLGYGREIPPRLLWLRKTNRALGPRMNVLAPELRITDPPHIARFSPWQIIVGTLTALYASRNLDKLLGLGGAYILCLCFIRTPGLPTCPLALVRWLYGESAPEPLADLVRAISVIAIQTRMVIDSTWPSTHHPITGQRG